LNSFPTSSQGRNKGSEKRGDDGIRGEERRGERGLRGGDKREESSARDSTRQTDHPSTPNNRSNRVKNNKLQSTQELDNKHDHHFISFIIHFSAAAAVDQHSNRTEVLSSKTGEG
jgi:hypothetical protein